MHRSVVVVVALIAIAVGNPGAQDLLVTGTVIDNISSSPIENASVQIAGASSCATLTDLSGDFALTCGATSVNTTAGRSRRGIVAGFAHSLRHAEHFSIDGRRVASPTVRVRGGLRSLLIARERQAATTTGLVTPLAKRAGALVLEVSAAGYVTKQIDLPSAEHDAGSVALAPYQETTGQWIEVTPPGANMTDYFGARKVVADPTQPNVFYVTLDHDGVWKSVDYGKTWTKVSLGEGASGLDNSSPWALAIAPDASYLLTCQGFGSQQGIWKSENGGVDWTYHSVGGAGNDVGSMEIDQTERTHVIVGSHSDANLYESVDGGETWTDQGRIGGASNNPHVHFLDPGTILAVSDADANPDGPGTWRGVRSGSTWPWTWTWTKVGTQQRFHGGHQMYVDTVHDALYNPGAFGIDRSTDHGLTWTRVSTRASTAVAATATTLYAGASYASGGAFAPRLQHAERADGVAWTEDTAPQDIINGFGFTAVSHDGTHYIIVTANWNAGVWRYVEP